MKENDCENMVFGKLLKTKKAKSREVSSRYLSPTSITCSIVDYENQSPQNIVPKPRSSTDYKYKSLEKSGLMGKLWPSFSSKSSMTNTLANHLGNDRLKDAEERKNRENPKSHHPMSLTRQKSCTTFSRSENEKERKKEKGTSIFGSSSMRYPGKIQIPGRFSTHSSKSSNSKDDCGDQIGPGRFSVDAKSLGRRCNSERFRSDIISDIGIDSESEYSDICSNNSFDSPVFGRNNIGPSYMAPTLSSRKAGIDIPSKYMQDSLSRSRRFSAESSIHKPDSPKTGLKFKNPITQRAANTKTSMALSPRTPNPPPVLMENKGIFMSNMKPPTSPSKGKKVGNFISMGLELLKGKKVSSGAASPLRPGMVDLESVHQLRMLNNSWMQLRYINARADSVHHNITKQAEENLVYAMDGLVKLRQSVVEKQLQLQRQKLELKLSCVLHSQTKLLEAWGAMEREHSSAVSKSIDGLQSAVCRVPLIDGVTAKEPQLAIDELQLASNVSSKINLEISKFSSGAEKTAEVLKEMADVAVQEKMLLEESLELFKNISILQAQERNLRFSIIQLRRQQEQDRKREKESVSA